MVEVETKIRKTNNMLYQHQRKYKEHDSQKT